MPAVMVDLTCIRGPGDREGDEVSDSLIADETIGRVCGTAVLDENWWVRRKIAVTCSFVAGLRDRKIVLLDALAAGLRRVPCFLRSVTGNVSQQDREFKLGYTLNLEAYSEPPVGYGS